MATTSLSFWCGTAVGVMGIFVYVLRNIFDGEAEHSTETSKPEILLGVCVMSARSHHKQRDAIRNTWITADINRKMMENESKIDRTQIKFVVGSKACSVHPEDRIDQYDCQEWTPTISLDLTRVFEVFTQEKELQTGPAVSILSLKVMHPIILKRIGILESITLSEQPYTVSAFRGFEEEEASLVKFSLKDPGIVHRGYRYQSADPVMLHKVPQPPTAQLASILILELVLDDV